MTAEQTPVPLCGNAFAIDTTVDETARRVVERCIAVRALDPACEG